MRLTLIAAITTAAGLGACAPVPPASPYGYSYGYSEVQTAPAAAPYGYASEPYYAPSAPYYAQPGYVAPYVAPGPTIIVGGERRFYDRDRYRYDRARESELRGRPNLPPERGFGGDRFGGDRGRQSFGGGQPPGPSPVAARPAPPPASPPVFHPQPSPQPAPAPGWRPDSPTADR